MNLSHIRKWTHNQYREVCTWPTGDRRPDQKILGSFFHFTFCIFSLSNLTSGLVQPPLGPLRKLLLACKSKWNHILSFMIATAMKYNVNHMTDLKSSFKGAKKRVSQFFEFGVYGYHVWEMCTEQRCFTEKLCVITLWSIWNQYMYLHLLE